MLLFEDLMAGMPALQMSTLLEINCLFHGHDPINSFPVVISGSESVGKLKVLIKDDDPSLLREVGLHQLGLFKVDVDLNTTSASSVANLELGTENTPQLLPWHQVEAYWPLQPPTNILCIIIKIREPKVLSGRGRTDISRSLLSSWLKMIPTLPPTIASLFAYLNKPLEEEHKIPISRDALVKFASAGDPKVMCSSADALQLFRSSEDEDADYFSDLMKVAIMRGPPADVTEDSFHSFWDHNIRHILDSLISLGKSIRNDREDTYTSAKRPTFGFLMGGVCTFRGEERPYNFFGHHPKAELFSKLSWTYDPAPYLLGYYAVGAKVTLAAITSISVYDIATVDLAYKEQRIRNGVRMIRLSSLLPLLRKAIGYRDFPELEPIFHPETGTEVEITMSNIVKTYKHQSNIGRVVRLRNIYRLLQTKNVPNVDHLVASYAGDAKRDSVVYLGPRGVNAPPRSLQEVYRAVMCILQALKVMHASPDPLFHRDIRWPNVIRDAHDPEKWFLIDWDDAEQAPTHAALHLNSNNHSPKAFVDNHGAEVDLWGVGRLIVDAGGFLPGVPAGAIQFGRSLMGDETMTAERALDDLSSVGILFPWESADFSKSTWALPLRDKPLY